MPVPLWSVSLSLQDQILERALSSFFTPFFIPSSGFITSNLMMPLFGLVLTLLLGWKLGDSIVPADLSPLMRGALLWCWRLVAPLLIAGILVRGLL